MKKKIHSARKNLELCGNCSDCCRYVAAEIDKPTAKKDYYNIIWFLLHRNVRVYVDHDGAWFLEFVTPCARLDSHGLCSAYEDRPLICRDYHQADCTRHNSENAEKYSFDNADDFKKFLRRKKIGWKFKI